MNIDKLTTMPYIPFPTPAAADARAMNAAPGEDADPKQIKLKHTCQEFEAVLSSTILKEGLKTARELGGDDEQKDGGSETYMDLAYEQIAYHVGRQGLLGLGDMLYEQVRGAAAVENVHPTQTGTKENASDN